MLDMLIQDGTMIGGNRRAHDRASSASGGCDRPKIVRAMIALGAVSGPVRAARPA